MKIGNSLLVLVVLCKICPAVAAEPDDSRVFGRLPNGIVELVALAYWPPTKQSQWWLPDGSPAAIGPFVPRDGKPQPVDGFDEGAKVITCLVRFANLPADASGPLGGFHASTTLPWFGSISVRRWPWSASQEGDNVRFAARGPLPSATRLTGKSPVIVGSLSWTAANESYVVGHERPPTQNNASSSELAATDPTSSYAYGNTGPEYYEMFFLTFLASARTTDFRVGVSMGPWETAITQKPDRGGRQIFSRDGEQWAVIFQNSRTTGGKGTATLVTHTVPRGRLDLRLVAVADDGSEQLIPRQPISTGFRGRSQSSLKEFRLQVRPYHWVEFQNVSLQPGWKTAVQGNSLKEFGPD